VDRKWNRYEFRERENPKPWEHFYLIYNLDEQRIVIEGDRGVHLERLCHMLNGERRIGDLPSRFRYCHMGAHLDQ
jgi:hypothetical protein